MIMQSSTRNKVLVSGLFLYSSAFFINYLVKTIPSLHFAKEGGIVEVAFFHCIASYLFFILLHRSPITFLGLGFFIGLAICGIEMSLINIIPWNPPEYFNFLLLHQIIADTIIFLLGICYLLFFVPLPAKARF
jgi:hypothetical protein